MTTNAILAMPAGREMDAAISERLMGWHRDVDTVDRTKTNAIVTAWKSP